MPGEWLRQPRSDGAGPKVYLKDLSEHSAATYNPKGGRRAVHVRHGWQTSVGAAKTSVICTILVPDGSEAVYSMASGETEYTLLVP